MTRLYLRVFLTFWCITAVIIVTTNVIVQWRGDNPDNTLQQLRGGQEYEPAQRFLFQMAGSIVNRNSAQVLADMRAMPEWSRQYFYIVDSHNEDLLGRPLPESVRHLIPKLTPATRLIKSSETITKPGADRSPSTMAKALKCLPSPRGKGLNPPAISSGSCLSIIFGHCCWPLF